MITIKDYIKKYNEQLILDIKELTIEPAVYWVKGPNGSGKTSFFRSIAGIIPSKGEIFIHGIGLNQSPTEYRRLINYAEAEPLLPAFLTGYELISFYNASKIGNTKDSEQLIEYFGIKNFVQNPVGTYSSGMLKKLSVLLAFIGQPSVVLLDEPLITIEDSFLPKIYELINKLHRERKITFLISSHQALNEGGIGQYRTLQLANQTITCVG